MSEKPQIESKMATNDGDGYMLARNIAASARLHFQFFMWKDTFGFNIHPSIPLPSNERYIADVATGTGIWLIDVSRTERKAHLYGFDISLEQAPCKEWLPSNVTLRTWNVFEDIPEDTAEKFDLIHIRLLGVAVRNGDTKSVFKSIFKMLKPGGHVQWDELVEAHANIRTINPSVKAPALAELLEDSAMRTKYNWPLKLAESAEGAGFQDARLYHFADKPDMSKAQGELAMLYFQEYATRLESSGQNVQAARYGDLLTSAARETLEGSLIDIPKVVCVARKPPQEPTPAKKECNTRDADNWYAKVIDIDTRLTRFPVIKHVYRTWSGLEGDELITHLYRIRDLAWVIAPYPCVGFFTFLFPMITELPVYESIITRGLTEGAKILDCGCGFGQNLRILATAGIPTENMYAVDMGPRLWDIGFELFKDKDKMKATFVQADILDQSRESPLRKLDKMDIISTYFLLHLFSWDKQVIAIKALITLSKPGTMIVGRQISLEKAQILYRPWGNIFAQDVNTFREIWRLVGMETGTVWNVDVTAADAGDEDALPDMAYLWLEFVATREK